MPRARKKRSDRRLPGNSERFKELGAQFLSASDTRLAQSELATSFGFILRLLNGVVQEQLAKSLGELGLRTTLYSLMLVIQENPGLKQQEAGQSLSIQQSNIVALIDELVERGLVIRAINVDDRRSHCLILTPAGAKLLKEARRVHEANERAIADALHPLDPEQILEALARVLAIYCRPAS